MCLRAREPDIMVEERHPVDKINPHVTVERQLRKVMKIISISFQSVIVSGTVRQLVFVLLCSLANSIEPL